MKSMCFIILFVGTVDRVEGPVATAEIVDKDDKVHYIEVTMTEFPCEIKEQEKFYIIYNDGKFDVRCAENEPE